METSEDSRLERALDLYKSGDYAGSEGLLQTLQKSPDLAYRALAALGMVRMAQGRPAEAELFFNASINHRPNADAMYGLGSLAEQAGDLSNAYALYQEALQNNPFHAAAKSRVIQLSELPAPRRYSPAPSQPATTFYPEANAHNPYVSQGGGAVWSNSRAGNPDQSRAAERSHADSSTSVFYSILLGDPTELSQQTLQLLDKLTIDSRRPRLSAYPSLVLLPIPVLLLFANFALEFYNLSTASEHGYRGKVNLTEPGIGLLITVPLLAFLLVKLINTLRTRYTIKGGWVRVSLGYGFIQSAEKPEEFAHLIDTTLMRSPWGLLTNNGLLILNFGTLGQMHLRGLAKFSELTEIRNDLINLSRMLRSNPVLKGLIA